MTSAANYATDLVALSDTDTVAEATRRMLADRVSDLPVVDGAGMLAAREVLAALQPEGAR